MLTSDMCLAYRSSKDYVRCTKEFLADKNNRELHRLECVANDGDRATDLDPKLEFGCCLTTNYWHLRARGLEELYGDNYEMCGKDLKKNQGPSFTDCCGATK